MAPRVAFSVLLTLTALLFAAPPAGALECVEVFQYKYCSPV